MLLPVRCVFRWIELNSHGIMIATVNRDVKRSAGVFPYAGRTTIRQTGLICLRPTGSPRCCGGFGSKVPPALLSRPAWDISIVGRVSAA